MDNNNFYKRTNKYNLEQILKNKDTIYIFDIDGTLTDFNYDTRDFAEQIERPNDYKQVRPLKTMQKFISTLDKDKVYTCSRSIFPEEHQSKTEFLIKNYNIKPENPDGDKEIEDKEKVYTHGFIFKKIDGSILKPADLAGAEFIVKKDVSGTTSYLKETADGKFEWTTVKAEAKKYTSSTNGKVDVKGLKVGSYTLEEIKAPEDYELPLNPNTKFEVTEDKKSGDTVIESSYKKTTKTPEIIKNMKKNRPFTGYERATLTFAVLAIVLASAFVLRKKLMKNNLK